MDKRFYDVDVNSRLGAQCPREIQVMRRVAEPKRGRYQNATGKARFHISGYGGDNFRISGERQVRAMLLDAAERNHDRTLRKINALDFRPLQVLEKHHAI